MRPLFFTMLLCGPTNTYANSELTCKQPNEGRQKLDAFAAKRKLISSHVIHAIQSAIAYEDNGFGKYTLPAGWHRLESRNDKAGLFIAVFRNEGTKELTIAIRGTEFLSMKDWAQNFLKTQSKSAYNEVLKILKDTKCEDCSVTVTGHSLGGGLAIQLSHRIPNVRAVAFNPSPRIGLARSGYSSYRVIFREKSEILAPLRGNPGRTSGWQLRYNVLLDFESGFVGTNVFTQHGMDGMATGMLMLAASWSEEMRSLKDDVCKNAQ